MKYTRGLSVIVWTSAKIAIIMSGEECEKFIYHLSFIVMSVANDYTDPADTAMVR